MDHAIEVVRGLIVGLFGVVVALIAAIEHAVRDVLAHAGIIGETQTAVLAIVLVFLAIAAIRLLGRVFAALIVVFLLLLLVHALAPGVGSIPAPP